MEVFEEAAPAVLCDGERGEVGVKIEGWGGARWRKFVLGSKVLCQYWLS